MKLEYTSPMVIRGYLWEMLKKNTDMDTGDYDGLVPIVPLAQQPEFERFDAPFIVYGYSETITEQVDACIPGNMSFVVYAKTFRELQRLTNLMARVFERGDRAARDVNEYSSTIPEFIGLRFGYIEISYLEGGLPAEEEGGRVSAVLNIRYEYYADYEFNPSVASWNPTTQTYVKS